MPSQHAQDYIDMLASWESIKDDPTQNYDAQIQYSDCGFCRKYLDLVKAAARDTSCCDGCPLNTVPGGESVVYCHYVQETVPSLIVEYKGLGDTTPDQTRRGVLATLGFNKMYDCIDTNFSEIAAEVHVEYP